jgi:hypothetical protein
LIPDTTTYLRVWSTWVLSLPRWLAGAARRSSGESWKRSDGSAAAVKECYLERSESRSEARVGEAESKSLMVSKVVRKGVRRGLKRERVSEVNFKICKSCRLTYMLSPFIF